jgi:LacI family transcriptional regulator
MAKHSAPSLKSLAHRLGLSITTVSRALAGYDDVAAATRERVQKEAAAQGYRPNALARRLQSGRTDAVALVLAAGPGRFDEPLFMEMVVAIGERLAQAELDLIIMTARPGPEEQKAYRRLVEGRRVDAAIIVRTRRQDERIRYLLEQKFPFVAHGRSEEKGDFAFVDGDGEAGFRTATERLIALGHRRVGLIGAPESLMFAHLRARGWRTALEQAGIAPGPVQIAEPNEENGHRLMRNLLAETPRPTAVMCATDRMAIGALRALTDAGLRAGTDMAVIGHDNISAATYTDPPLTTLELPIRRAGTRLVEVLLAVMGGGANPTKFQEVWPLTLIERGSHGPAPNQDSPSHSPMGGQDAKTGLSAP